MRELSGVFMDPPNSASNKRVYQVWKGSNRFFLGGRLVFGPDARSLLLTLFLIIAPVVIFIVFVGRHLMKEFPYHAGIAIVVVAVVHTCVVLVLLLLTSGRDPGIIPRSSHPPEAEEEAGSSSEWSASQTPKLRLPRTKDVIVNGVVVKVKYCDTCMLYRPPRCSHCSICNNCVERFDHHCPWVGQCIGRRNYPYFFAFVLSTTLLCFYIFAMCALRIKTLMNGDPPHTVWKALQRSSASAFLMAYAFLATWFVGGLTVFHLYLMSTNQTTYENFRYRYDNKVNPYNRGILHNLKEILCSGIPPSKVDFRAKAPPEAMGFGNYSFQQRSRDNLEMMSSSSGKKILSDLQPGGQSTWRPQTVATTKSTADIHALDGNTEVGSEEMMHGIPEDLGNPASHELESPKHGAGACPRRSSRGWHSANSDISSEGQDLSSSTVGGLESDQAIFSLAARKES